MMSRERETSHKWEKILLKDTPDQELLYKIYRGHVKYNNKETNNSENGPKN